MALFGVESASRQADYWRELKGAIILSLSLMMIWSGQLIPKFAAVASTQEQRSCGWACRTGRADDHSSSCGMLSSGGEWLGVRPLVSCCRDGKAVADDGEQVKMLVRYDRSPLSTTCSRALHGSGLARAGARPTEASATDGPSVHFAFVRSTAGGLWAMPPRNAVAAPAGRNSRPSVAENGVDHQIFLEGRQDLVVEGLHRRHRQLVVNSLAQPRHRTTRPAANNTWLK